MKPPLRQNPRSSARLHLATALFMTTIVIALAGPAIAQNISGAIYTTFGNGTTVNGNIYPSKDQVYLNGGPQNMHGAGLSPDGDYYFQVTDPSGAVLLSLDPISCRVVTVSGAVITGHPTDGAGNPACYHINGDNNSN